VPVRPRRPRCVTGALWGRGLAGHALEGRAVRMPGGNRNVAGGPECPVIPVIAIRTYVYDTEFMNGFEFEKRVKRLGRQSGKDVRFEPHG
jgi:hypothetical protein